jgi:hypothetical protein
MYTDVCIAFHPVSISTLLAVDLGFTFETNFDPAVDPVSNFSISFQVVLVMRVLTSFLEALKVVDLRGGEI